MTVLYLVTDGNVSGGNIVCLRVMEEAARRGFRPVLTSPAWGPICEVARAQGFAVRLVDTRRSFHLGAARTLARLARAAGASLIHAHAPFAGSVLARYAGLFAGVPVITHAHARDTLNRRLPLRGYQVLVNWTTTRMRRTAVIAVAEDMREAVIRQGVNPRAITVVYNGVSSLPVEPSDIPLRHELQVPAGGPLVLHVGRLCEQKGQMLVIEAAARIAEAVPAARFVFVGEDLEHGGAYLARLRARVARLGLDQAVRFLGQRSDVPALLAAADLSVLPSFAEGLPIVVLESMAQGRPVIASQVGGIPELLVDGESGTLVPPGDVDALAAALLWHLRNPEASRELGRRGAERVRTHFTMEAMLEGTFAVYAQLLRASGRRQPDGPALQVGSHAA